MLAISLQNLKIKMSITTKIILVVIVIFYTFSYSQDCPPTDTVQVEPPLNLWSIPYENSWDGLEVMTWNVKEFPLSSYTVNYITEIISDILPDVIVFQEISDIQDYENFSSMNPAYDFIHTNYGSEVNPDLGMAVRSDCVEIVNYTTLFSSEGWAFAYRYPLKAELGWSCGDAAITIQLINIHFKAFDEGVNQRLAASQILADYIQYNISENIIVAGDFNDEIDEPEGSNSLWPLVSDPNSFFTTTPIVGNNYYNSFPWGMYSSFIDHILISAELFDENTLSGEAQTLRIDDYTSSSTYQNYISDHRPVLWKILIDVIDMSTGLVINEIMNNPVNVSDSYGEWFEVTNIGPDTIDMNGLTLKDDGGDQHTISQVGGLLLEPGEFVVFAVNDNSAENGGVSVDYVYSNFALGNGWDEIIFEHPTGAILDEVWYDNGATFPDPAGGSMMLIDPYSDNSLGANWMTSTVPFGDGDFGTPGSSNFSDNGFMINVTVNDGWNLIGLPVIVSDSHYQSVFPNSVLGTLYGYDEVYTEQELLINGNGYWLRFNEDSEVTIEGSELSILSISLSEGWNLISGISQGIEVDDIDDPDNIVIPGTYYSFGETYTSASTLEPGKGYWVKANSAGIISLTFSGF